MSRDREGSILAFRNVSYRVGNQWILRDITLAVHPGETKHYQRDQKHGDPSATRKFTERHNQQGTAGGKGTCPVKDRFQQPASASFSIPVNHHPGLRQRECKEGTNGKQGNQ